MIVILTESKQYFVNMKSQLINMNVTEIMNREDVMYVLAKMKVFNGELEPPCGVHYYSDSALW